MLGKGDYVQGQVTWTKGIIDDIADNASPLLSVTKGYGVGTGASLV